FWAYIAFSQYMLIWIANIPEEGHWYLDRMKGGWQGVGIFLILCHFVFPFFFLLFRWTKFRTSTLGFIAVWILGVHLVDMIWMVMPAIHQAHWDWISFGRTLVAFVGVGGLTLAVGLWLARG